MASIESARHEMYRRQILGAAEAEFARNGFANTKMGDIAKGADVSLATVYKTFVGKAEIWDDLHAERMRDLLARVEAEAVSSGSAVEQLLAAIASVAHYLTEHPGYLEMSLWAGTGWAGGGERVGHGVQQTVWASGLETLAKGVEAAVAQGEVPAIDPRIGAGTMVATLQVWLAAWVDGGRQRDADEIIAAMAQRLYWMLTGAPS